MEKEKRLVIDIIAEAFDANKSVNYVVKQDKSRVSRVRSLIDYSYTICEKYGEILVHDHKAVAIIHLPHKKRNPYWSIIQDLQLIRKTIGIKNLPKVLRRESVIKGNHPDTPFCHLWYIGVSRNDQRNGHGTALLRQIVNKYDELQLPIYLETSTEENVSWYEKNGFKVYEENIDFGFTTYMIRRVAGGDRISSKFDR